MCNCCLVYGELVMTIDKAISALEGKKKDYDEGCQLLIEAAILGGQLRKEATGEPIPDACEKYKEMSEPIDPN